LQYLYGANQITYSGDTIYTFDSLKPFYRTIWDAGGADTFNFEDFDNGISVNIRGGELSILSFDVDDSRWSNKQHGNLGVAFGCKIENVSLGSGNDYAIGNDYSNVLEGGEGEDTLKGAGGKDFIYGGFGHNTFSDEKDGSVDRLYFKSDQFAENWLYSRAGMNPNGQKVDIIKGLDQVDRLFVQGVKTSDLTFRQVNNFAAPAGNFSGIGIYANGFLEGLYTGGDLSAVQLQSMTVGAEV